MIIDVQRVFCTSFGEDTQALYAKLELFGAPGVMALNLFRAAKCSTRAKECTDNPGLRNAAYARKNWSIGLLVEQLLQQDRLRWGWKQDIYKLVNCWVLYVDLPSGQVSFHMQVRGLGPDYAGRWDGIRGETNDRVIRFVEHVLYSTEAEAWGGQPELGKVESQRSLRR